MAQITLNRLNSTIFARKKLCTQCHNIDYPKKKTKGHILIELILWLSFILPGIVYSFWRLATRHDVCCDCESANIIPTNSKRAIQILKNESDRLHDTKI